jgi:hypothetical protein
MNCTNNFLIEDLRKRVEKCKESAVKLKLLPEDKLRYRNSANSWNVLECLEHLNLYGDFYILEIKEKTYNKRPLKNNVNFKSGMLGEYFAKSLLPKKQLNKMKTFKDKDPMQQNLDTETVFKRFLDQQDSLLSILNDVEKLDLNKIKTNISISKWIKLRLGDTLRVVIYHNERHIEQANRIVA